MVKLSGNAPSTTARLQQQQTIRLGDRLLTIIEKSRRVGEMDERINRMQAWLSQNQSDPRHGSRSSAAWQLVSERNALVSELVDDGGAFDRQREEMDEWVITEIQMALGIPVNDETACAISEIARRWWGDRLFEVLDRYGARHYEMTEGVSE